MGKIFESRSYQTRIHDKSLEYFDVESDGIAKTLMIESPTGSGKTVMAMRLAKHLEEQGHKVGWIAHRKELLEQAEECNKDFFGVKDIKYISLFNRTPEQYKDRTVVIVDEAQHDAAKSASVLHDVIRPKIIVGLTATPYRTDRAQLCFQKVIRDAGIHQLIREGFLAEYDSYMYDQEWTPENVAGLFASDPAKWGKSVIYFLTKVDAKECCALLKAEGIRAGYVVGSEPREEAMRAFRADELQVLTNVAVLTEGFDEPSLKSAFVRPSSKGPTVQMAGRAFRRHPEIPVCNIIQSGATKYPFTRHATAHNQFIMEEGEWRSIDPKNLAPFFAKQRRRVAQAVIEIPDFLKNQDKERFASFGEDPQ
jgi:superfamily II DNA or RNA helicase